MHGFIGRSLCGVLQIRRYRLTMMDIIKLEHGSGGALSRKLTEELIYENLKNERYPELSDATILDIKGQFAFTTDTYTIDPLFFPGGDIGKLAIFGTCNDLAVSGAKPLYLSLAFVIEEGFPIADLKRILSSIRRAANEAGIRIVTGDTKVVPKNRGGGIYINTTGIGTREFRHRISGSRIESGDAVVISGPIGSHGIAIMASRESLPVGPQVKSDVAFLYPLCRNLYQLGEDLKFMRDATRGGIAAVLNEAISDTELSMNINESSIPLGEKVDAISNILGLNPLEIANEGVFIAVVRGSKGERALSLLRETRGGDRAQIIGHVDSAYPGKVILETISGGKRILDFPRGLMLPRIC